MFTLLINFGWQLVPLAYDRVAPPFTERLKFSLHVLDYPSAIQRSDDEFKWAR